jgi:L-arabinokinase
MGEALAEVRSKHPDFAAFERAIGQLVATGFFAKGTDIHINRTPGRLDLMGGNDDYTGGLVFEATIREATLVAVQPRTDRNVVLYNPAVGALGWKEKIEFTLDDLTLNGRARPLEDVRRWINQDPRTAWSAYVLGGLYFLIKEHPEKVGRGLALYLTSNVPLGKGVSSSAALEVASMKAMAAIYGVEAQGVELASWTQWVEIALTQSACGIMDQLAVVLGDAGCFVPMLCQPCQPGPLVKMPESLKLWGVDSGVRHSVAGIEYESARAATFMGYRLLCNWEGLAPQLDENGAVPRWVDSKWNGYLANLSPSEFRRRYESRLPETLDGAGFEKTHGVHLDPHTPVRPGVAYPVRGATRYAVEENWRVQTFFSLISKAALPHAETTPDILGELMYQSHIGYSQCGLGSEVTDYIVELVRAEHANGLVGAKVTGGGAGGTVAVLGMNTAAADAAFQRMVERYQSWSGTEPYVFTGSSTGADGFGVVQVRY